MYGMCKGCGESIVKRAEWPNEWHSVADNPREHYVNVCAGNLTGDRKHSA